MQLDRAVVVLERLRDGVHPSSGEALPADHPLQDPEVVRALYTVLGSLPRSRAARRPQAPEAAAQAPARDRPPPASRAGVPWTPDEDERLARAFDAGASEADLAGAFDRSRRAIRLRLVRLGRLTLDGRKVEGPAPATVASAPEPPAAEPALHA